MSNHIDTSSKAHGVPEEETLLPGEKGEDGETILDHEKNGNLKKDGEDKSETYPSIRRVSEIVHQLYTDGETVCGIGSFKGKFLQKFANKNSYVVLYGILGCVMGACGPYLTGTLTTLEKRFKIPSTKTGTFNISQTNFKFSAYLYFI